MHFQDLNFFYNSISCQDLYKINFKIKFIVIIWTRKVLI